MEARGFIFGSLAAWELGASFIPLRKPNKLPYKVESLSYDLEYGSAEVEIHKKDIKKAIVTLNKLGKYNFSQGTVVRKNKVIAIEGKYGTERML